MDGNAVIAATEQNLKDLGLHQLGHVVALKAFCRKTPKEQGDRKKELCEILKQSSVDRTVKQSSRKLKEKAITLGWQHYDRAKKKYVGIRESRGGGVRTVKLDLDTLVDDVMTKMESFFFPHLKNHFAGRLLLMNRYIGNSSGDIVGSREMGFNLREYVNSSSFARIRLYLLTRRKGIFDVINYSEESDSDDFENGFGMLNFVWLLLLIIIGEK